MPYDSSSEPATNTIYNVLPAASDIGIHLLMKDINALKDDISDTCIKLSALTNSSSMSSELQQIKASVAKPRYRPPPSNEMFQTLPQLKAHL